MSIFHASPRLVPWLLASSLIFVGCSHSGPQRAAVEGRVVIGNQPLKAGRILFLPQAPTLGPATSVAVVDGAYQADRAAGPLVGQHQVQIEADLDLGFPLDDEQAFAAQTALHRPRQIVPPEFNVNSQLTTEIRGGKVNRCDVIIPAVGQSAQY